MSETRCPACGAENQPGATYCVSCARRLDAGTEQQVARRRAEAMAAQATSIRWPAIIVSTLVVLVILALVAVFLIR